MASSLLLFFIEGFSRYKASPTKINTHTIAHNIFEEKIVITDNKKDPGKEVNHTEQRLERCV